MEYFLMISVYIISLNEPRNNELKKLQDCFRNFEIVEAINGNKINVPDNELTNRFPSFNKSKVLSKNEWACTQSHIIALSKFLDSNNEFGLILEDDAEFNLELENLNYELLKIINMLHRDFSKNKIVYCGGMEGLKFEKYFQLRKFLPIKNLMRFEIRVLYRAMSYIVTRRSANLFHDYLKQVPHPVADDWINFVRNFDVKIQYSHIFKHPLNLENSAIEKNRHGK